jgi:hypothetical protein
MGSTEIAVAIFEKRREAERAVTHLHQAGFRPDHIALARQRTKVEIRESEAASEQPAEDLLTGLANYFSDLLGFDETPEDYQEDFQAGRTILRVRAGDRFDEALSILQYHGGYNRKTQQATQTHDSPEKP